MTSTRFPALSLPGLILVVLTSLSLPPAARAQAQCAPSFVGRNAYSGDTICVSVDRRQQVADENAAANLTRSPTGGAWGPDTCKTDFVWRLASPKDHVCVRPESRDLVAQENANPRAHVATAAPAPAPAPPAAAYQYGQWSDWGRQEDVQFRYRWGWNPAAPTFPARVDLFVEVKNTTRAIWKGSVRATACQSNTLGGGEKDVTLNPGEDRTVSFSTPNCNAPKVFVKSPSLSRIYTP